MKKYFFILLLFSATIHNSYAQKYNTRYDSVKVEFTKDYIILYEKVFDIENVIFINKYNIIEIKLIKEKEWFSVFVYIERYGLKNFSISKNDITFDELNEYFRIKWD